MYALLQLLSMKDWLAAHASEQTYTSGAAVNEAPPSLPTVTAQPANTTETQLAYRFARIQAHSGDLLYRRILAGATPPGALGTGDLRVFSGGVEFVQLQPGDSVSVQAVAGTANGAVLFAR